jgi:hypothetical protein
MHNDLWYALPLIISLSLVYAATRHEALPAILRHAARVTAWTVAFMGGILLLLAILSWAI